MPEPCCRPPSSPVPVLEGMEEALPHDLAARQLYPISIGWDPPFTMLVDLVGHGDPQVPPAAYPLHRRLASPAIVALVSNGCGRHANGPASCGVPSLSRDWQLCVHSSQMTASFKALLV